ncbi:MAG: HEPN domain-containing protein [Planctomycetales bacterium]|nr:HEPN domain-containing protein [Planctomycetales bacterium]
MSPTTSRDFLKAAAQRLNAAEALFNVDLTLDAQYVGGYAVECAFKALILDKTPLGNQPEKLQRITHGAAMHRPEVLLQELRTVGITLTPQLSKRMRRFDWVVDLRYETGRRDRGETRGLLRTCREILQWVEDQLP